ncbi:MAG: alcohol dehydrogenase catalytic domain-containing protein [Sphingomonadales bacterium]|nr:alcohol dehydrogenase catalytic domain-containing protein [Sphingomonadales bacterium]
MRAAVFHEAGQPLTIETLPDPAPAEGEVVIAVHGAGICGSDLHVTQYPGLIQPGTVLGHEYAGTIAALGAGVSDTWTVGDRVTALPLFPCCGCEACDAQMPNLCVHGGWVGASPERPGAFAQYVVGRAALLQPVPTGVGEVEAAMIEPLAVGHHTVSRGAIRAGEAVLILGGGPIGAAAALFARAAGASHVVVSEPAPARRDRCCDLGATATIDPSAEDVATRFAALTGSRPHVVFECVGIPGMLHHAVELVGLRGRVVVAGVLFEEDRLPPLIAFAKEVTITYSQAYTERDFAAVIDALARHEIDAAPLHTRTVGFADLPTAFEALRSNPRECKVLIDPR